MFLETTVAQWGRLEPAACWQPASSPLPGYPLGRAQLAKLPHKLIPGLANRHRIYRTRSGVGTYISHNGFLRFSTIMPFARSVVAILLCCAVALPASRRRQRFREAPATASPGGSPGTTWPHQVPKVSFEDSPRIDKLMHAGNIYLSLRDAIALALENNLDIEYARFNPKLADANSMRVSAGALLRSVSSSISSGPSSASLGVAAGASLGSAGTGTSTSGGPGRRAQRAERCSWRDGHFPTWIRFSTPAANSPTAPNRDRHQHHPARITWCRKSKSANYGSSRVPDRPSVQLGWATRWRHAELAV